MLDRLFPKSFDNSYRGHVVGLWLLVPILILRLLQGINCVLRPADIARSADAIPLDHFPPDAAAMIVLLFALSALGFLWFGLLGLLALVRYRSMVPLIYLAFLIDTLARRALNALHPTVESVAPGGHAIGFYINMALLLAIGAGFLLSMAGRRAQD